MRVAVLIENQIRSRTEQVGVKTSKRLTGANLQQIQIWDQLHGRDNLPSPQHTHSHTHIPTVGQWEYYTESDLLYSMYSTEYSKC